MKISDRDRTIVLVNKGQKPPEKPKSHLQVVAQTYGIHVETLRKRAKRNPDKTLEELAREPVISRSQIGRIGKGTWNKVSNNERANREGGKKR